MKITERLLEYKKLWLFLALSWTATVAYFCLKEGIKLPSILPKRADKLGHVIFHMGIVGFWFLFLKSAHRNQCTTFLLKKSVLVSIFFGIVLELCQALFTSTRSADWQDVCANVAGAVVGSVFILYGRKKI